MRKAYGTAVGFVRSRRWGAVWALGAVLLTGAFAAPAAAADVKSLCGKDETAVFACPAAGKLVSLCLAGDRTLYYRFGRPGAVELSYPKTAVPAAEAFSAGLFRYATGANAWVRFNNEGVRYSVFTAFGRWGKDRAGIEVNGVAVDKGGKRIANVVCRGEDAGELGPELFTKLGLKFDADGNDDDNIDPGPFVPKSER